MECRSRCGACCIAPSITAKLPGMPLGKPAGVACVHLDQEFRCSIFGHPERPEVCQQFQPEPVICGDSRTEAMNIITDLEQLTSI